jgi:PKD repeat protein
MGDTYDRTQGTIYELMYNGGTVTFWAKSSVAGARIRLYTGGPHSFMSPSREFELSTSWEKYAYSTNDTISDLGFSTEDTKPVFVDDVVFSSRTKDLIISELTLISPEPNGVIQRTQTAIATLRVIYADGTPFTSDNLGSFQVWEVGNQGGIKKLLQPEDYDPSTQLWTIKWKIPLDYYLFPPNLFMIGPDEIIDKDGKIGPSMWIHSDEFIVEWARLLISDFKTDQLSYDKGDIVHITFNPPKYPDGEITNLTVPWTTLDILDPNGEHYNFIDASFDEITNKFTATWTIPETIEYGNYQIKISQNTFLDEYGNLGPENDLLLTIKVEHPQSGGGGGGGGGSGGGSGGDGGGGGDWSGGGVVVNMAPSASFTLNNTNLTTSTPIAFNATESIDSDGSIQRYEWDFGDGNTTSVKEPIISHNYNTAGNYTVKLTIFDDKNLEDTHSFSIKIEKRISTLSLISTHDSIQLGETIIINGLLNPNTDNETISITVVDPDNSTQVFKAVTDNTGRYDFSFTPSTVGTWQFTSLWEGNTQYASARSSTITINVTAIPTQTSITANSMKCYTGDQIKVSGQLTPVVTDYKINILYKSPNGEATVKNVSIDSNGEYQDCFISNEEGEWEVQSSYPGDPRHLSSFSKVIWLTIEVPNNTIRILVTDDNGSPIKNAQVQMLDEPTGQSPITNFTNSEGLLEFTALRRGCYKLNVTKSGYGSKVLQMDLLGTNVFEKPISLVEEPSTFSDIIIRYSGFICLCVACVIVIIFIARKKL